LSNLFHLRVAAAKGARGVWVGQCSVVVEILASGCAHNRRVPKGYQAGLQGCGMLCLCDRPVTWVSCAERADVRHVCGRLVWRWRCVEVWKQLSLLS